MSKKDWIRFWLHYPVGVLGCLLTLWNPAVGVTLTIVFLVYEAMNDWRKKDNSYKDIYGFAFGYATPATVMLIAGACP